MAQHPFFRDLTGQTFGRLLVLEHAGYDAKKHSTIWLCRCECGIAKKILGGCLKSGMTRSCGCLRNETTSKRSSQQIKHGKWKTKEFRVWTSMLDRCNNPRNHAYALYGGRGIKVCGRWLKDFGIFLSDMGECPKGMSIERKNNDLGYSPDNCKWANVHEQSRNRRDNVYLEAFGRRMVQKDWAREIGMSLAGFQKALKRGESVEFIYQRWKNGTIAA